MKLPEDERGGRIGTPAVRQELGRLVALEADVPGLDAEIGEQAVERRYCGQHSHLDARLPGETHRFMSGAGEDARMAVEGGADPLAGDRAVDDLARHLGVDLGAGDTVAVELHEGPGVRVQAAPAPRPLPAR